MQKGSGLIEASFEAETRFQIAAEAAALKETMTVPRLPVHLPSRFPYGYKCRWLSSIGVPTWQVLRNGCGRSSQALLYKSRCVTYGSVSLRHRRSEGISGKGVFINVQKARRQNRSYGRKSDRNISRINSCRYVWILLNTESWPSWDAKLTERKDLNFSLVLRSHEKILTTNFANLRREKQIAGKRLFI